MRRWPIFAFAIVGALALLLALASSASAAPRPQPPTSGQLERATEKLVTPRAERRARRMLARPTAEAAARRGKLFPRRRVVGFYGAPQMSATILGRYGAARAARRLRKQARPYKRRGNRRVVRAFDLVAVLATADRGRDGLYRMRQPNAVIGKYLRRARKLGGRLILDIQPGRSPVGREIQALRRWISKPDVDVAIDPEWNVGRRGVPGKTTGSIGARGLNKASLRLAKISKRNGLPPKALYVHQFRRGSIKKRRRIKQRNRVQMTLSFDGIGSPRAKRVGYRALARRGLFDGFALFYSRDSKLMGPRQVLRLKPSVDYVFYQ